MLDELEHGFTANFVLRGRGRYLATTLLRLRRRAGRPPRSSR